MGVYLVLKADRVEQQYDYINKLLTSSLLGLYNTRFTYWSYASQTPKLIIPWKM